MSLAVLAALLLAGAGAAPPEAQALKEAGDRKRAAGDAEGARQDYLAAVAAFGGYAEAHEALGEALLSQKRFAEAARSFERAVEIEPGLALAWYDLGYASRRLGDLGRARDAWERYLALRPEDLDARLGLAESLQGLGEREAALQAYQAFAGLAQPVPEEAGRVERARQAMAVLRAELAARAPPAPSAGGQAGAAPSTEGEAPRPASPAASASPEATPVPAATPAPTIDALPTPTASPAPAPAASSPPAAGPASTGPPSPGGLPGPASSAEGEGSRPSAPVIILPVPAQIPAAPAPAQPAPRTGRQAAAQQKLRLGDRLLAEGDVRLALFAFQDAVNQDPQSAQARLRLGRVYLRLDHLDEALEQFGVGAALDPGDAEVRRALEETRSGRAHV